MPAQLNISKIWSEANLTGELPRRAAATRRVEVLTKTEARQSEDWSFSAMSAQLNISQKSSEANSTGACPFKIFTQWNGA
jgi:hypothetical protein